VPAGRHALDAVRRANDLFRLRDCAQSQEMVFADQGELFPVLRTAGCLRYEIGTCLGPCAGACSRADYRAQVREAQNFLAGIDCPLLTQLEGEMTAAAVALQYERAAALRDKVESLRWLQEKLQRLQRAREQHSFIYPVQGIEGQDIWYLIHHGRVCAGLPLPHTPQEQRHAAAVIAAVYQERNAHQRLLAAEEVDGVLLVAGWFQRHHEERTRTLRPEEAFRECGVAAGTWLR
jgi:excinuclease ABC subunit C